MLTEHRRSETGREQEEKNARDKALEKQIDTIV